MEKIKSRRKFLTETALAGVGIYSAFNSEWVFPAAQKTSVPAGKRVGIIGLDTSHSVAFTKAFNSSDGNENYSGYKVVAAYPKGSHDIESSIKRVPEFTAEVRKAGVEIMGSIEEMMAKVDVVLLETNDGRLHLEQAILVMKAGKRVFIDKPVAASLADVVAIFKAAEKFNIPFFSSSALRYTPNTQAIRNGEAIGKVLGADTFSPAMIEQKHTDLFWYGIHGVEALFTVMGPGCREVRRVFTKDTDVVVGVWQDGRIGTFRGTRSGRQEFGGNAFGVKGVAQLGGYSGYQGLLKKIVEYFDTGIPPVDKLETLEIYAFMEAADISKWRNGAPVLLEEVLQKIK